MQRRRVNVWLAWFGGVMLATLDTAHLLGFVSELVPRHYAFLVPIATVAFFTVALYLSNAKHPHVILDGFFTPQGTLDHSKSGLFVANVGDSPALNVTVESMGIEAFGVTFDPVSFVAVGEHKPVTVRYGSHADMFDGIGAFLSMRNVVIRGPGQKAEPVPHPIRFTYENANGRTEVNEEFELRFIVGIGGVPIASRYIIGKRSKVRRTIRDRLGIFLARLAVRVLQRSPNGE
jgi:hypothetical protein